MGQRTFLLVVDGSDEFSCALSYAARRAAALGGDVALLAIVEPEGIETWSGVEQAVTDEAFDAARRAMVGYEQAVQAVTGRRPLCYYRKGEMRATLLSFIDEMPDVSALVLAAENRKTKENPLVQYFATGKGLHKLTIPLIIVPTRLRDSASSDATC